MGYTRLSDGINFNTPDGLNINANKSWEIGFNLFQGSLTLSRDRQWGITTGLGWGYRSFRLGNNYAFRQIDGVTGIVPGVPDEEVYTKSRLRYFYFRHSGSPGMAKKIQPQQCSRSSILFSRT